MDTITSEVVQSLKHSMQIRAPKTVNNVLPRQVPLMLADDCVSCMVIDSVGLFDELITPVNEPERFSDEPSDPPSLDGAVALEQADATVQTIRIKILRMRPHTGKPPASAVA